MECPSDLEIRLSKVKLKCFTVVELGLSLD